jgi:hypothetical protein
MTGPVLPDSQPVCPVAHAHRTATALAIYLGAGERGGRPVRFRHPADMGPVLAAAVDMALHHGRQASARAGKCARLAFPPSPVTAGDQR